MFNKKTLMSALATIVVAGGAILFMNAGEKQDSLFAENVEALAQDEGAIITCGEGRCGRCFEEKKFWPFYKCNWTGAQSDYCDCDKIGWL